jgi:hypothetical protein
MGTVAYGTLPQAQWDPAPQQQFVGVGGSGSGHFGQQQQQLQQQQFQYSTGYPSFGQFAGGTGITAPSQQYYARK